MGKNNKTKKSGEKPPRPSGGTGFGSGFASARTATAAEQKNLTAASVLSSPAELKKQREVVQKKQEEKAMCIVCKENARLARLEDPSAELVINPGKYRFACCGQHYCGPTCFKMHPKRDDCKKMQKEAADRRKAELQKNREKHFDKVVTETNGCSHEQLLVLGSLARPVVTKEELWDLQRSLDEREEREKNDSALMKKWKNMPDRELLQTWNVGGTATGFGSAGSGGGGARFALLKEFWRDGEFVVFLDGVLAEVRKQIGDSPELYKWGVRTRAIQELSNDGSADSNDGAVGVEKLEPHERQQKFDELVHKKLEARVASMLRTNPKFRDFVDAAISRIAAGEQAMDQGL